MLSTVLASRYRSLSKTSSVVGSSDLTEKASSTALNWNDREFTLNLEESGSMGPATSFLSGPSELSHPLRSNNDNAQSKIAKSRSNGSQNRFQSEVNLLFLISRLKAQFLKTSTTFLGLSVSTLSKDNFVISL